MFGGNRPGRGRAAFGPVPIPRGEKVQLLPLPSAAHEAQDRFAVQSLLSLPSVVSTSSYTAIASLDENSNNVAATRSETNRHLQLDAVCNSSSSLFSAQARHAQQHVNGSILGMEPEDSTLVADPENAIDTKDVSKDIHKVSSDPSTIITEVERVALFGQPLEYACGEALRKNVLEPVIAEYNSMDEDVLTEAPRLLSLISKGHLLFMQHRDKVSCGSVERICNTDGGSLVMWYDSGDKYLSYVDEVWAGWWVRRCHTFDQGCEMHKLCDLDGKKLGVVYIERNLLDRHFIGEDRRVRVTLIRGIRIVPQINREVKMRRDLLDNLPTEEMEYNGVATLIFCHVIFLSMRYGAEAIAVHPPKSERAEKFYESLMGPALLVEEDDGRRYYRLDGSNKWNILQNCFRYQLNLFIRYRDEEALRAEDEEKAAIIAIENEDERLKTEATDAAKSELAGRLQAEDDARIEEIEAEESLQRLNVIYAAHGGAVGQSETTGADNEYTGGIELDSEPSDTDLGDTVIGLSAGLTGDTNHKNARMSNGYGTIASKRPLDAVNSDDASNLVGSKKQKYCNDLTSV